MSSPVISNTVSAVITEKKTRAPTLPAKFGKFIQFGYFLIKTMNQDAAEAGRDVIDDTKLSEIIHLRDSVTDQQAFVQSFFDQNKDINKEIRSFLKVKKTKPPKAQKISKATTTSLDDSTDTPSKKKRAKKSIVSNGQPDIVAEIVALANKEGEPTVPSDSTKSNKVEVATQPPTPSTPSLLPSTDVVSGASDVSDVKVKKGRKAKPVTMANSITEGEVGEVAVKEKKSRKVKAVAGEKQVKAATLPDVLVNNVAAIEPIDSIDSHDSDDEEELKVDVFLLHGKQFLIDDDKNVYDFHSNILIGKFNSISNSIV